jgi:hypothetical protein
LAISVAIPSRSSNAQVPSNPAVVTLAGNGRSGVGDGPRKTATFALPSGLAKGRDGTVFVSDEAGQRIRAVARDGTVRTVAGSGPMSKLGVSVVGGYKDGPALRARFNHPMGLAFDARRARLFIADSLNGCIRQLSSGTVSTVIGQPGQPAAVDGGVQTARLLRPRGLALDSSGVLYIADQGVGLRRFDASGTLSTIKFKSNGDNRAVGVSVAGSGNDRVVFVTTPEVLFVYHPATGADEAYYAPNGAEGGGRFGDPNQIAAIDAHQLLMTDARSSNVRYVRLPALPYFSGIFSRTIAGGSAERPSDNAGFADGSLAAARFSAPEGILSVGSFVIVADAGNRRIRRVSLPNIRVSETGPMPRDAYDSGHYQIVYIGASLAFWDVLGDDSFCAVLESRLNRSGTIKRPAKCHTIRIDSAEFRGIREFVANFLSYQHVDLVVVGLGGSVASSVAPKTNDWNVVGTALRSEMTGLLSQLRPMHAQLAVCWNYYAPELSATEGRYFRPLGNAPGFPNEPGWNDVTSMRNGVVKKLAGLPLLQYDSYDDVVRYERSAMPAPLYAIDDSHLTSAGMALLANGVASVIISRGARR